MKFGVFSIIFSMLCGMLCADFDHDLFNQARSNFMWGDSLRAKEQFSSLLSSMQEEDYVAHPEIFLWIPRCELWGNVSKYTASSGYISGYIMDDFWQLAPCYDLTAASLKTCIEHFEKCKRYCGQNRDLYTTAVREMAVAEYLLSLQTFDFALFDQAKKDFFEDRLAALAKFDQLIKSLPKKFETCYPTLFLWRGFCNFYNKDNSLDVENIRSAYQDCAFAAKFLPHAHLFRTIAKGHAETARVILSLHKTVTTNTQSKAYRKLLAIKDFYDASKGKNENRSQADLEEWVRNKYNVLFTSLSKSVKFHDTQTKLQSDTMDIEIRIKGDQTFPYRDFPYSVKAFRDMEIK